MESKRMDNELISNIIGYVAAGVGIVTFMPQVITAWKTKQTKDISFLTFFLLATVSLLWVMYGILMSAVPIIFVNTVIFILSAFLLFLKRKYG